MFTPTWAIILLVLYFANQEYRIDQLEQIARKNGEDVGNVMSEMIGTILASPWLWRLIGLCLVFALIYSGVMFIDSFGTILVVIGMWLFFVVGKSIFDAINKKK